MDRNLLNKVIEAIKCNEKNEELELLSTYSGAYPFTFRQLIRV